VLKKSEFRLLRDFFNNIGALLPVVLWALRRRALTRHPNAPEFVLSKSARFEAGFVVEGRWYADSGESV